VAAGKRGLGCRGGCVIMAGWGLRLTASMCACAALILAMGTRNGLHDT
jgi:hypothetical protein